ncbi:hypothetical protein MIMGU_mgv1a0031432mg, partial [Erythranthe guttata]
QIQYYNRLSESFKGV